MTWLDSLNSWGSSLLGDGLWLTLWTLIKIVCILLPLILSVAYLTYAERKVIGLMQGRLGPNRVGYYGLLQPFADVFKLIFKEIIVPNPANSNLFILAPVITLVASLTAWAVVPFSETLVLANVDASLLYIFAFTSMGVYGVIIAGWASNSKYALLGCLRSASQVIAYEIAMGFALVCVFLVAGSLNLTTIVNSQQSGAMAEAGLSFLSWNWLPLLPMFLVYLISGVAETNRAPFDVAEGESEIVAGFHIDYSGTAFALFFLAEYANIILISLLTSLMFLGGWDAPFAFLPDGFIWLGLKTGFIVFLFLWFRATFPRYRYDQIMRLGWKIFIPLTIIWVVVVAIWRISPLSIWH